jgi:hypothetical protein
MDIDYPSAHSMDSSWYAVDKNGHVALFITGAGGAMPNNAFSPENAEAMEEAGLEDELEHNLSEGQLPDREKLFVYETGMMDEGLADCYHREQKPKQPLHVDQLPPDVRQAVKAATFDTLDFNTAKVIQPVELTPCVTWDPAYLASDGRTVRPVAGREAEYADFAQELVGLTDELVVEGLAEGDEDEDE